MKYILAIDIGTTAMKAAIFDEYGARWAKDTEEYTIITPHAGWAEMEADTYVETFRRAVHTVLGKAKIPVEDIASLTMSVQGETSVFLDSKGQPIRRPIVWFDTRAAEESEEILREFGIDTIQKKTGQVGADAIWPGAKLLWLSKHEPEHFRAIDKVLQLNGYFAYLLTGRTVEDDSILGSSIYWDMTTRKYWPEMLDYIGITKEQLPEVVTPGSAVGKITEAAALRFGLSAGTTVNIGAIDLGCGAIGVGNVRPGIFSDSTGSALCTVTITEEPVLDPNRQMPCYCGAVPGQYLVHAYSTGGMMMRWFRDVFCELEIAAEASTGMNAYDRLDTMASAVPPGSEGLIVLPHLQGAGPPDLNPDAKSVFYGMTIAHKKGHVARAIMESVSMVLARMIEGTRALGIEIDSVISYSGGAKSPIWCQIKADATGLPIKTTKNDESAACLGAAILAGVELGIWGSVEEAATQIVEKDRYYDPNPENRETYRTLLQNYKHLMDILNPLFTSVE